MPPLAQSVVFALCEEPYCVWDRDICEVNRTFAEGIDVEYFHYIATTHIPHLEGDNAKQAAMALRSSYHLSLETLFSLIGAILQAPNCVPAWILRAKTWQIRRMTDQLANDHMSLPISWRIKDSHLGFEYVAKLIFQHTSWAQDPSDKTVTRFGELLYRLSHDFLSEDFAEEYNSIKHGFRARSGGFTLAIGIEHEYGIPPPPGEMHNLGGSSFGTSFYCARPIGGAPKIARDPHFGLVRKSLNWLPDATAARLFLAALMIRNLKAFLLILTGTPASTVQFHRPEDSDAFEQPWREAPGVNSLSWGSSITEDHIYRASGEELQHKLHGLQRSVRKASDNLESDIR